MTKIQDLIESSRRRDEAATKGPWEARIRKGVLNAAGKQMWHADSAPEFEGKAKRKAEFISASRTTEPLFREIAAVAVEAIHCEDCYPTPCNRCEACEALSKIQSLIDEAEKKPL